MMKHQQEAGIVLMITLWVIVVLASVSTAFIRQVQLEAKMVGFQRDITIVDSVAKAGLRQALVLLREDKIKDSGEDMEERVTTFLDDDNFMYDGGSEAWAHNDELYIDVPFYEFNDKVAYYYVEVEDEASKFPINNSQVTMEMTQHLLELSGVSERDSETLAAAIIDWRDADDIPSTLESGGDGDEYSTYNSGRQRRGGRRGESEIPEIALKNAPIQSIDELLLIPGMTPAIVFGTADPDENRSGRYRRKRMRKGEYLGLSNLITVYERKINLNTVKYEVLESLLYPILGTDAENIAQDWVEYRDGRDNQTYTDDDQVLKTMDNSDLDDVHWSEVDGFTEDVMKALDPLSGIVSNIFVITCMAEYEGLEKGYRAVVERTFT
ncbi:MAG: general secretion pathway protein GspK, partial [Candidatus Hinthialibacter sp.]